MPFQKATKLQAKGRLALCGPSGSGKTYTALRVAKALGKRIALVDTEKGSASKYADLFDFDTCTLSSFAPATYVDAIHEAESAGYEVLIIDSLTHAWSGKEGALEQVDNAAARSRSGNRFTAWREVTPMHNKLIDSIIGSDCHVIATMRVKTEWVLEDDEHGKKVPRKIGLAPVQRDGMEYEFDVVVDLDNELNAVVSKTRCSALSRQVFKEAGENDLGAIFSAWLTEGAEAPVKVSSVSAPSVSPGVRVKDYMELRCEELGVEAKDYALGALKSILRSLEIPNRNNAKAIADREEDICAAIDAWTPPNEEETREFAEGPPGREEDDKRPPQPEDGTFGDDPKRMRGLHGFVKELGYPGEEGHRMIHNALPPGVKSLKELPLSAEYELRARLREITQSAAMPQQQGGTF